MPAFAETTIGREEAISQLIASIAMEELALAHILNAEGEKIQHVLGTLAGQEVSDATIEDLQTVDGLVTDMLESVRETQTQLMEKMTAALAAYPAE